MTVQPVVLVCTVYSQSRCTGCNTGVVPSAATSVLKCKATVRVPLLTEILREVGGCGLGTECQDAPLGTLGITSCQIFNLKDFISLEIIFTAENSNRLT